MPIRSFKDQNVVACFAEPSSVGSVFDINAFRNRPARDPGDYLDLLTFHSNCFQYEVAYGPVEVAVTHSALPVRSRFYGVKWDAGPIAGGGVAGVGFTVFGNSRETDILLASHGLGYVPKFMVALDGRRVPDGWQIQYDAASGARQVSVYATSSGIYLRETAMSGSAELPAIALSYRVYVFRTRAADPGQPMFGKLGSNLVLARGIVNSSRSYLRRGASTSPFALNLGPTLDVNQGAVRSASGGVVVTEPGYAGSMAAPAFRSVGF